MKTKTNSTKLMDAVKAVAKDIKARGEVLVTKTAKKSSKKPAVKAKVVAAKRDAYGHREGTTIAKVFAMAKVGTTRDAIKKVAKADGIGSERLFWCLRTGTGKTGNHHGIKWTFNQTAEGKIKIGAASGVDAKSKSKVKATKVA